jgi:phosphatidylglycerol:prolipoprotein diacylglycerol transferase
VHPVLFVIPLPAWSLPLGPVLLLAALAGLVVAALGRRSRATALVVVGGASFVVLCFLAVRVWGTRTALEPMPIYSFGAFLCLALLAAWFLAMHLSVRAAIPRDIVAGAYFATAVAGLVGARLLYVLTNLGDFHSVGEALAFRSGGLVFYGAVGGGVLGAFGFLRGRGVPFAAFADIAAPSVCAGATLGRIGCYLAGCDYGVPLSASAPRWAARIGTFPRWPDAVAGPAAGSPAWLDHVVARGLPLDSQASLPVHPTQLYEAAALAVLVVILLRVLRRRRFLGEVFAAFVMTYSAVRFLIETLRDDPERRLLGPEGSPRVLWALGCLVLAGCFIAGPARSIRVASHRTAACLLALAVPFAVSVAAAGRGGPIALSTSQWIALASFVVFVPVWRKLEA